MNKNNAKSPKEISSQTPKTNSENEKNKALSQLSESINEAVNLIDAETERMNEYRIMKSSGKMPLCLSYFLEEIHKGFYSYADIFGQDYIKAHKKRLKKIHNKIQDATIQFRLNFAHQMTDLKKTHLLHICCMGDDKDFGCDYDKVEKAYICLVSEMVHLVDDFYNTFIKE